jgi:cell division protein FtsB
LRSVFNVYSKEKISKINLEKEKTEYEKMSSRKDNLLNSIDYLKTDDGVESEIRNKFRLVKEGESVTVIVNNDSMSSISIGTSTKIQSKSLLSSIFEWFSK